MYYEEKILSIQEDLQELGESAWASPQPRGCSVHHWGLRGWCVGCGVAPMFGCVGTEYGVGYEVVPMVGDAGREHGLGFGVVPMVGGVGMGSGGEL